MFPPQCDPEVSDVTKHDGNNSDAGCFFSTTLPKNGQQNKAYTGIDGKTV